MGCINSKEASEKQEEVVPQENIKHSPQVEIHKPVLSEGLSISKIQEEPCEEELKQESLNEEPEPHNSKTEPIAEQPSVKAQPETNNERTSVPSSLKDPPPYDSGSVAGYGPSKSMTTARNSYVSADLNAIVDDQGTINPLVSRQLSMMSHYSVKSESGSVVLRREMNDGLGFTILKLIGRGGFGNVYLGEWEGQVVAVKVVTGGLDRSDQPEEKEWELRKEKMAQMEAVLMASLNHPNIVNTYKVLSHQSVTLDPEVAALEKHLFKDQVPTFEWHIIMEYCNRGSLSRALANHKLHEAAEPGYHKWDAWSSLETLKEITRALIFLHEHHILHCDLKAANVLLLSSDQDRRGYISKLSDFGLSRVMPASRSHIKTQTFGTVTHMPPELLSRGVLSPSADVYALGVLLWELLTADRVFKHLSDSEVILAVVTCKARPSFPSDSPLRYRYLAERCWAELPEARPSLATVLNELDFLQNSLCPDGALSPPLLVQMAPKQIVHQPPQMPHRRRNHVDVAGGGGGDAGGTGRAGAVATTSSTAAASGAPNTNSLSHTNGLTQGVKGKGNAVGNGMNGMTGVGAPSKHINTAGGGGLGNGLTNAVDPVSPLGKAPSLARHPSSGGYLFDAAAGGNGVSPNNMHVKFSGGHGGVGGGYHHGVGG
eukprot:CAMPEP_0175042198 /NCGR_PEP_ID=MMETSP0052_2-20121109/2407_1 /TAXON_ID=51329 ORGANISM="Polytomella parva, Strain SAG 63-3" /NCGR_SAMPLE_ID=MMETSP0052_2 /ASSEMBLY_ACC=CAM_ASM_000194 /LENGTH=656 /DNA_ID=CAMNT_0016304937 /DNA_START=101 /DNA_END=2068 /DNA_ORIENTATION=+